MSKSEISRMTLVEAREAYGRNPVALIPLGSVEEHGPTAPMGDYKIIDAVCRGIAEGSGAIMAPTMPLGYSEAYRAFPGCLSVRPSTLEALLEDTVRSFTDHDLDHIVFACGHHGNMPIIEQVARRVKRRDGLRLATVEPLRWFTPELWEEVYGTPEPAIGHGSDPITSIMLHLTPEDVRMDLADEEQRETFMGYEMRSLSAVDFDGVPVHLYADMDDLTPNGVLGDIDLARAERGKQIVDYLIETGINFVEEFKDMDTTV